MTGKTLTHAGKAHAAILVAAERLGATTLYSEDLNDGQAYGSVTVVNPFREGATA